MEQSLEVVNDLLERDIDELYLELANSDGVVVFGASEGNEENGRSLGKVILTDHIKELRPKICGREEIKRFIESKEELPTREVVLAVLDVVLSALGIVPIFVVTALLLKFGLRRICSGQAPE